MNLLINLGIPITCGVIGFIIGLWRIGFFEQPSRHGVEQ